MLRFWNLVRMNRFLQVVVSRVTERGFRLGRELIFLPLFTNGLRHITQTSLVLLGNEHLVSLQWEKKSGE